MEHTFDRAVELLDERGAEAARSEVQRQQQDFNALDYGSLAYNSQAIKGLRDDPRFQAFTDRCIDFYKAAIEMKRIAYESFDDAGKTYTLSKDGFTKVARLWKQQVEQALGGVRSEFRKVECIRQS